MATSNPSPDFTREWMPPRFGKPRNPIEGQRLYNHIRTISFYLDAASASLPAFQGSPIQVGIEPLIAAFVPALGPVFGLVMGVYVIGLCALFDVPLWGLIRMFLNLMLDVFAGYIPVLGTMVDVAFKANLANLALLEDHLKHSKWAILIIPQPRRWFDWTRREGSGNSTGFRGF